MICNPSLADVEKARRIDNKILIARLDGTCFYRADRTNMKNFIVQRKPKLLPYASLLSFLVQFLPFSSYLFNKYLNRASGWLLKNADALIFQSVISMQMHVRFMGFRPHKRQMIVIPNGVDIREFAPSSSRSQTLGGFPAVIVSASTYRPHKRLAESIELVNRLRSFYPEARLHVLGDPDPLVAKDLEKIDTSACTFYGRVSLEQLKTFYAAADFQLSLSLFDPCPNVVCEGLASGLPVVTPMESGASELVGSENKDWCVKEGVALDYLPFQTGDMLPAVPYDRYIAVIRMILADLDANRRRARSQAENALNIELIRSRYVAFLDQVKTQRDGKAASQT
jgi:glycosyltransferase involved in cell wall biosynthesis